MRVIKYTEELKEQYAQQCAAKAYQDALISMNNKLACLNKDNDLPIPDGVIAPEVIISDVAMAKATALVQQCSQEIAWHGIVIADREKGVYYIKDVVVPPQHVTGTSVNSDLSEWAVWASQFDNETYNNIRCHMHSHVNMNVFSSGTDDDYQKDVVLKDGNLDYYIFLIFNKKGELFARFYDVEHNVMFDNKEFAVCYEKDSISEWAAKEIDEKVKYAPTNLGWGNTAGHSQIPGQMSFNQWGSRAIDDTNDDIPTQHYPSAYYGDDDREGYVAVYGVEPEEDPDANLVERKFGELSMGAIFFDEETDDEYTKIAKGFAIDSSGCCKVRFSWNRDVYEIIK